MLPLKTKTVKGAQAITLQSVLDHGKVWKAGRGSQLEQHEEHNAEKTAWSTESALPRSREGVVPVCGEFEEMPALNTKLCF